MTDLAKPEQQLLDLLKQHDSLGNGKARELLGWDEDTYNMAKVGLHAQGLVAFGCGRGGSIQLAAANGQEAAEPLSLEATEPQGQKAKKPKATKATDNEPIEKQLWKTAAKLRKNIDAAEYKHIVRGLGFLKYISDAFVELYDKLKAEESAGANPENKAANDAFVPPGSILALDGTTGLYPH
jgi:hypothetical protein